MITIKKFIPSWFLVWFMILIMILLMLSNQLSAQSLTSLSGLLNVPTADLLKDGEISIGATFLNNKYFPSVLDNNDALAYYLTFGFLPFVELSLRFTKELIPNYALGDRMFSFRIRIVEENKNLPSIVLGVHDPFYSTEERTNRFTALYLVATKNFSIESFFSNIKLNIGYGTDILQSKGHQYIGFFGGSSIEFLDFLELIGEYDSQFFNSGIKINLFNHITLSAAYMNLDYFCFGANYRFRLE